MLNLLKRFICRYADLIEYSLLVFILLFLFLLSGCAGISPQYDSNGNIISATSYGFLRTVKIHQKKADGSELLLETQSNTGEVLGGVNSLIGTGVGAVRDLAP